MHTPLPPVPAPVRCALRCGRCCAPRQSPGEHACRHEPRPPCSSCDLCTAAAILVPWARGARERAGRCWRARTRGASWWQARTHAKEGDARRLALLGSPAVATRASGSPHTPASTPAPSPRSPPDPPAALPLPNPAQAGSSASSYSCPRSTRWRRQRSGSAKLMRRAPSLARHFRAASRVGAERARLGNRTHAHSWELAQPARLPAPSQFNPTLPDPIRPACPCFPPFSLAGGRCASSPRSTTQTSTSWVRLPAPPPPPLPSQPGARAPLSSRP